MNFGRLFFSGLIVTAFLFSGISLISADYKTYYTSAWKNMRSHKYADAAKDFRKSLDYAQLSTEEVNAVFGLAYAYRSQKKYRDAIKWVERIFEIPDLKYHFLRKAYRDLINDEIKLKKYDDALDTCKRAIKSSKSNSDTAYYYYQAADIFLTQKQYANAIEALNRCIDEEKNNKKGGLTVAAKIKKVTIYYKAKQYSSAAKVFSLEELKKIREGSRRSVCFYSGMSAYKIKDYPLALSLFNEMPNGKDWWLYIKYDWQGKCYSSMKKYPDAIRVYNTIMNEKSFRGSYRANGALSIASVYFYHTKDYKNAQKYYQMVSKISGSTSSQRKSAVTNIKRIDAILKKTKKK
jgi:tetratricopeptide (TPR) repeat protein